MVGQLSQGSFPLVVLVGSRLSDSVKRMQATVANNILTEMLLEAHELPALKAMAGFLLELVVTKMVDSGTNEIIKIHPSFKYCFASNK